MVAAGGSCRHLSCGMLSPSPPSTASLESIALQILDPQSFQTLWDADIAYTVHNTIHCVGVCIA